MEKQGAIENRMSQIFGKGWEQRGIGAKIGQKLERVNRWIIGSHVKNTAENSLEMKKKQSVDNTSWGEGEGEGHARKL